MLKKKVLYGLLGVAGATCICVGASVAYMTDSHSLTNVMTVVGPDGLNAKVEEPSWDPDEGLLVVPGDSIPKDPQVVNTSQIDLDESVALKVEFVYSDSYKEASMRGQALSEQDMAYVCDVYDIDWNADSTGEWVRFDGEDANDQTQCFYYKDVLKRNYPGTGDTTKPLFTTVSVDKSVNNERYSYIQDMGGFDIKISGMAVQQMTGEDQFKLSTPKAAYDAGLFTFQPEDTAKR